MIRNKIICNFNGCFFAMVAEFFLMILVAPVGYSIVRYWWPPWDILSYDIGGSQGIFLLTLLVYMILVADMGHSFL